jgi:hypothetical protein
MGHSTEILAPKSTLEILPSHLTWYRVRSKWVPGTSDRLELRVLESDDRTQVGVRWFTRQFGREAMNAIYLRGKFEFDCDDILWKIMKHAREQT